MDNRLFTFGCSFTNFSWPTWADILGREYDQFENWALNGAGNCLQLYSLIECHKRNQINKDDTVIIMWTSVDREDRWKDGGWQTHGTVYSGYPPYDGDYVEKFTDPFGFVIRDLAVVSSVKHILETIGCRWHFLSMVPLVDDEQELKDLYKDELELIKPSIYETVFNYDWSSRPGYRDLEYYKNSYKNIAGKDWPSVEKFMSLDFSDVDETIIKEIKQNFNLDRTDEHPIPAEHLEYLDLILPEITISDQTRQWTLEQNKRVLDLDPYYANMFRGEWKTNIPKERF